MRKILFVLMVLSSCKQATTEDVIKGALVKIESEELAKDGKIENLSIDSIIYSTTSYKEQYDNISRKHGGEAGLRIEWVENKIKELKEENNLISPDITNNRVKNLEKWLSDFKPIFIRIDSSLNVADTLSNIYKVKYRISYKTSNSSHEGKRIMFISKDSLKEVENFDITERNYEMSAKPPIY